jgi:hypothetical protein
MNVDFDSGLYRYIISTTLHKSQIEMYLKNYRLKVCEDGPEIGTRSIDWAQLSRLLPEDGYRVQSPKGCF